MSVMCCRISDFALTVTLRNHPEFTARPLALLGTDERVCVVSESARDSGVRPHMRVRQAQMRCPDLLLHPLDLQTCQAEQHVFLDTLTRWDLPVEELGWGRAYVDLHTIAKTKERVQPLATEAGQQLRRTLGTTFHTAIGWDSGKFTAQTAATVARPGHVRLVDKAGEVAFLSPLSITLLPLPAPTLQQLHWLGIRTLDQFAALPRSTVLQRFGKAGQQAQRWARGQDDRPVRSTVRSAFEPIIIDLDPPTALLHRALDTLIAALRPRIHTMAEHLEGCRHMQLLLSFVEGSERSLTIVFTEPVSTEARLSTTIVYHLRTLNWPAQLTRITVTSLETGELPAHQMALFPELDASYSPLQHLAQKLMGRYGAVFLQGQITHATHPLAERRSQLVSIS